MCGSFGSSLFCSIGRFVISALMSPSLQYFSLRSPSGKISSPSLFFRSPLVILHPLLQHINISSQCVNSRRNVRIQFEDTLNLYINLGEDLHFFFFLDIVFLLINIETLWSSLMPFGKFLQLSVYRSGTYLVRFVATHIRIVLQLFGIF